ncbi:MAG TPA: Gfo/Idh/MocA family oxidoreductase [Bryobacterales bacterium]|nr:Gfo/Idh/MocA family oxidoreductase [Bryobacterales bacterium]
MAIRVALLGTKFMGKAHSQAYRNVNMYFPDAPKVEMRVIVGRNPEETETARRLYGWQEASTDWKAAVARPDIDLVDIATTGDMHCRMALAAAQAGKHIVCEKPLANTLEDARKMLAAVEKAKVRHLVMHNYRRVPAVALAKRLMDEGRLGKIYHFRARYLQDWAMSPDLHLVWRFRKASAGSGALGDLGAHIIDLGRYLCGEIREVASTLETFIKQRPAAPGSSRKQKVTVDDAVIMLARFKSGALGTFEATRFARGRKNQNTFEINGDKGSLSFDLEHLNVLKFYSAEEPAEVQGFHDILCVTKGVHPYADAWWFDGHILGYEHTFTHTIYDFLKALEKKKKIHPDFTDGVRNQAVLDAAERAAAGKKWVSVAQA